MSDTSSNNKLPASKGVPEAADIDAGIRLRMRRVEMNMSQQALGERVGVTFQQIQKYEKGANRISASKLAKFAEILSVSPAYFFDTPVAQPPGFSDGGQTPLEGMPPVVQVDATVFQRQETFELLRAYYTIADPKQRRKVLDTVKAMASLAKDAG